MSHSAGEHGLSGYSIWLSLAEAERQEASALIMALMGLEPSATGVFEPHVTLVGSVAPEMPLPTMISAIQKAVQTWRNDANRRLTLRRRPAQSGEEYYQSVLVPFESRDSLLTLREACEKELGTHSDKPYFPHLSLLYGNLSQARRNELARDAEKLSLPEELNFDEITVACIEGLVSDWRVIARITLG